MSGSYSFAAHATVFRRHSVKPAGGASGSLRSPTTKSPRPRVASKLDSVSGALSLLLFPLMEVGLDWEKNAGDSISFRASFSRPHGSFRLLNEWRCSDRPDGHPIKQPSKI